MSEEDSTVIVLTDEDMVKIYDRIMSSVPFDTPGQLRDAIVDPRLCCATCMDWSSPYARAWQEMDNWLYLSGKDWRTVE